MIREEIFGTFSDHGSHGRGTHYTVISQVYFTCIRKYDKHICVNRPQNNVSHVKCSRISHIKQRMGGEVEREDKVEKVISHSALQS